MQQDPEPVGPAKQLTRQPTAGRAASGSDRRQEQQQQQEQEEEQEWQQEVEVSRVLCGGAEGQRSRDGGGARPMGRGREGAWAAGLGGGAARAPLRSRL